jgi:antirestriction protein ArdC
VLGHTSGEQLAEYRTHRGIKEFEAEATAYLCANELEQLDAMDASESRAYIQGWLRGERPDDQSIKRVFAATTKILKAGRIALAEEDAA